MNLYLIRHGEIEEKYLGRYVGSTDVELSNNGKEQAKRFGKFFKGKKIDTLYVSPLKRAKQTAQPIIAGETIHVTEDARIREIDFGPWEGKTSKEVEEILPKDIPCSQISSGGERYADFSKRVRQFFTQLLKNHEKGTVVVITHKGVIREAFQYFLSDTELIVEQAYGALNHFVIRKNTVVVKKQNMIL